MKGCVSKYARLLLWVTALWAVCTPLKATPFEEGNTLFKEGKFKEAEAAYNRSLALDGDSPATRYNLGKVQEALADPARAMLEWERALRLAPGDPASKKALQAFRETMGSKVAPETWWQKIQPAGSVHHEAWLMALGAWMLLTGLVVGFVMKRTLPAVVLGSLGLLCGGAGFAWHVHTTAEADMALVLERSVVFRASPAKPARALDSLPAGSRVRLLDSSGGWHRAEAADRQIGWLPEASVERISP
jgi:tetratricopeptide (TPR) repeat protein